MKVDDLNLRKWNTNSQEPLHMIRQAESPSDKLLDSNVSSVLEEEQSYSLTPIL